MEYHIKVESGETIASFVNKGDRDTCIEVLRDLYDDCVFDAIDEDE